MAFPRRNINNEIENPGEMLAANLVERFRTNEEREALIAKVRSTPGGEATIQLAYNHLQVRKMKNAAALTSNADSAEYWSKVSSAYNPNISESSKDDARLKLKVIFNRGDHLREVCQSIHQALNLLSQELASELFADTSQSVDRTSAIKHMK